MSKRIFQIAYNEGLMFTRAALLERRGFHVDSALGNKPAKAALRGRKRYDMFIVGHAAEIKVRMEMVSWLRKHCARTRILALNPSFEKELDKADFNVRLDGPEEWLGIVTTLV